MRTWPAVGLLVLTTLLQVSLAEDLYWEGEEDGLNEFLEVKEDSSIAGHLKRFKRDWWNPFSLLPSSSTTTPAPENEIATEDQDDTIFDSNDDEHAEGSGSIPEKRIENAVGEKTLRVTFVVMQPYQNEYSNRDSPEFQQFSKALAQAVNVLFDNLPGTQKASLIRIQSRLADNFSCKVTLDIVTIGYEDTDRITETLHDHIRNYRYLGGVSVKDDDFSANVVNPGSAFETCQIDEIQCDDGNYCIPGSQRCDGNPDCNDGSDEQGCPNNESFRTDQQSNAIDSVPTHANCENPIPCASSSVTICKEQQCDGYPNCPSGDDEDAAICSKQSENGPQRGDQTFDTTPTAVEVEEPVSVPETCPVGEFRCDETRCVPKNKVCDEENDCFDGTDELNCPESCGAEDFRCYNGKCIPANKKCDRVFDCPSNEDEEGCACASDEFQCTRDGACIEARKRCDGVSNCRDGTDEQDCACGSDQWQCDKGNCIPRSKRCNGKVDCPSDRSDERNCLAKGHFKCRTGKIIPENLRCNRHYDCPSGDYSDEQNCPCGQDFFRCKNGHCIPKNKRCDRTNDCQDGSDEIWCNYGKECMAYQFKCTSGQCVHAESRCNGTFECGDKSDEISCPCKRGQFNCRDGSCINIALRCDGRRDCSQGEDEVNCGEPRCPAGSFTCDLGSTVQCATHCDGIPECENNEDEENCHDCQHECDGRCLEDRQICDGNPDCSDGSDEEVCENCDGIDDFRCANGECIRLSLRCNNASECSDDSDELNCNETMKATNEGCLDNQFRCRDGSCINQDFLCDGTPDCYDRSDETNCPCEPGQFQCSNGDCIPQSYVCNDRYECSDGLDERDCDRLGPSYTTEYPNPSVPTVSPYTTTRRIDNDYVPGREPSYRPDTETGYPNSYSPYAPGSGSRTDNRLPTYAVSTEKPLESTTIPRGDDVTERNALSGGSSDRDIPLGTTTPRVIYFPAPGSSGYDRDSDPYNPTEAPKETYFDSEGRPYYPYDYSTREPSTRAPISGSDQYGSPNYPNGPGGSTSQGGQSGYPGSGDQYGSPNYPNGPGGSSSQGGQSGYPGSGDQYGSPNYPNGPGGSSSQGGQSGYPGSGDQYGSNYPNGPGGSSSQGGQSGYPGSGDQYGSNYPNGPGGSSSQGGQSGYPGSGDQYGSNYPNGPGGSSNQGGQSGYPGSGDQYGSNYPNGPGESPSQGGQSGYPGSSDDQYGGSNYPNGPGSGSSQGGQSGYPGSSGGGRPWSGSQSGGSDSVRGGSVACQRHEWRCENGPCIDARRRCDGHIDCPLDFSDEFDCPYGSPVTLNVKTYPDQQTVRFGGDVVFQCRDEGPIRAPVRWVRDGGRSLKPGSIDRNGRLELYQVTGTDSGVYICQTPSYLGRPGSEVRVTLTVENDRAPQFKTGWVPRCKPYEATCGNGDCIPKSAVCDGKIDCGDKSDEDMCNALGQCEPNQFQCDNRKCVLKTWLCDSEDDCGDGSDERSCKPQQPGQPCLSSEFSCRDGTQCVPKSFHCDGRSDCMDKSDESGCAPVYIVKPPTPANLRLNTGDTLILRAEAKGNPVPVISWRLNWGHVPPQCTSTSEGGIGVLTCPNMRPEHSGAYSAEALNNKGTTFANPDAIVFVSQISPCPAGYFNNEARSEKECIRCFCFGESTQCRSADLFTYNMPTPLGQGGTRLQGVTITPSGEIRTDASITNHYYYQPLRNGATVTKLVSYDESSLGNFHPYLSLPETYQGQQLTSYGGHIKYNLAPHARAYDFDSSAPTVIIKGKYATLFHFHRGRDSSIEIPIDVRLTPENWVKPGPMGFEPSAREDIMMALDQVDTILLRADLNNAGVNISNFVMESAQHINIGLGAASLVEECTCPPGYEGLSCQKCSAGYVREKSGPWLGNCVRETCPPGTYGDPASGLACKPCPCPLTNRENQFSRTCSLGPDGTVSCDCFPGYDGKNCEVCAPGYEGNPLVRGDSCRVQSVDQCNIAGTETVKLLGECQCKDNVQGRYCDQCKNNSFYLSNEFRHGCALCFCSGVSQQCMSSNLRRKTTTVNFNVPNIVDQVKVYNSALAGSSGVIYGAPAETELKPVLTAGGLTIRGFDRSRPTVYYWSMPVSFSGDKVTSYGGYLRYVLDNVPSYVNVRARNNAAADVQLVSENHLTFQFTGGFKPTPEGVLNASVQFLETGWHRSDGKEVSREHFLLALADVKAILIKATYGDTVATPLSASIETAEPDGSGQAALHVEQCVCPTGYIGTSCEDCAPGYTRSSSGLYLEHCGLCECNGRSRQCHPETGICYGCMDNTEGQHCELCRPGYERDGYDNCVEIETTPSPTCRCDPRGSIGPCDENGRCTCKANVEGLNCDRCRAGTFGLESRNPDGCISCFCSGATQECQEANHFTRIALAAPIFGDNYGGYVITDMNFERVIKDNFVPVPDKSELMYVFPYHVIEELYWSLPVFSGNRVTSYGGTLSLRQEFKSESYDAVSEPGIDVVLAGDDVSVYWVNHKPLRSGQSMSYQVPLTEHGWYRFRSTVPASRSDMMRVLKSLRRVLVRATIAPNVVSTTIADVSMDIVTETAQPGAPAALSVEICTCPPGHLGTSCESCAAGYYKDKQDYCVQCPCGGHDCQLDSYGQVTCNCRPPYTGSDCSAIVGENQATSSRPPTPQTTVTVRITSPTITIQEVGSSVNFTCQAQSRISPNRLPVTWTKANGNLPQDRVFIDQYLGLLQIVNLQITDSGVYICHTSDGVSSGQATVTLRVPANEMTVPVVSIKPAVNDYYEGDRIVLECVAQGSPSPSIFWQRASRRPLPLSSKQPESLFIIDSAKEEDSGEYRCIATNTAGSGDNIAVITIRPRPSRPPRDRLTVSPSAPVVNEGQSTRVICTAPTSVPTGTIDWVRQDNKRFQANVRSDRGILYIDVATPENAGVYLCQTHAADVAPVPILVTVTPLYTPPPGEKSNVSVPFESLKIPSGESGTIDCTPSGNPLPRVNWTKYQGRFGPGVSQRGDMLIINNAQESDAGYYVCQGTIEGQKRPVGIIYVNVEIEKREAPIVQIWPEGEHPAALGSTFEFHCRVLAGIPEPDVTWSRSGSRALSRTTHIRPNNILRFESVDVNDEGEYICTGSNLVGSSSASAVIKVRSPPEINLTPNNYVTVQYGEPLRMECRANGYPEPMVSIKGPDRRELAPPTPGIATIRVASATERDDGDYTCTASSAAGTLEEPFVVRVNRGDAFPDFGGSGEVDIDPGNSDPNYNPNYNPNNYPDNPEPYNPGNPDPYDPNYNQNYDNERPSSLVVSEGQRRTEVDCFVSGDFGARWDRSDRQPLQRNAVQEGNKLVIYNVSKADSGEYVCSMYNSQTNNVQQARYIRLLVIRPPIITLNPATQTVSPGQSPYVECIVDGDDITSIQWIPYNRNPSSRVEIRNATLIFHQIEVEDAGEYQCFAKNKYANASATAEVIVAEETEMETSESHEHEQWVRVGAAVKLSCNMTEPGVTVHWTKDGRAVPRSVRFLQDGSLYIKLAQKSHSGNYICHIRDERGRTSSNYINLHIEDPRQRAAQFVKIDQQRQRYITGENVEVSCRALSRDVDVNWEKYGTRQYVDSRRFGGGAMLIVHGVTTGDAGVYRCVGVDINGQTSYEDFNLEVEPGSSNPSYPRERDTPIARYTAHLRDSVDMPCNHNLEEPVNIKWSRIYSPLPSDIRSDQPILQLRDVTEGDAGTYVCRVSNNHAAVETRAILRVVGVVPSFNGEGWVALPTIKDAYRQFDIEVSFKPADANGLILYNSQYPGREDGDYLALELNDGVPRFTLDTGYGPIYVKGDRPLQLNIWHTIRLNRIGSQVTMDVDNIGPFSNETADDGILELREPLYVAGVPDLDNLPAPLAGASGFVGCVSMLILGRDEKKIMMDYKDRYNVEECDTCAPNLCLNDGVCQEARNEKGFVCICPTGFAGEICDRRGEACHPGLCGPGKCHDTEDGYKCVCPVTHTGRNCEESQSVVFPAFTGSAYLALTAPDSFRFFKMSMKVKPTYPVQDGIIMYCAESNRGLGGFTSLAVRNQKLEFRYDLNDGNPLVLISNRTLPAREWTDVQIMRAGPMFSLIIDMKHKYDHRRDSANKSLNINTPMFVGGVDETIILNNNTGVTVGFNGCIKDVTLQGNSVNIVASHNYSGNVQDCNMVVPRGDIPEENTCLCKNGGTCNPDGSCSCSPETTGPYCDRVPSRQTARRPADPCAVQPCRNGGTCRPDFSNMMNHSCDCPLGFAGTSCQMELNLFQSVSFNGNGYLELPANLLDYSNEADPATIALAIYTTQNGVLFYQTEITSNRNDFGTGDSVLLKIDRGHVTLEWNMGSGYTSLTVDNKFVTDGERHQIIVRFLADSKVELTVDEQVETGFTNGIANRMNADSNIYIGGIPDRYNFQRYPNLSGCIEQVEFMNNRPTVLGDVAVAGRNTQRCRQLGRSRP